MEISNSKTLALTDTQRKKVRERARNINNDNTWIKESSDSITQEDGTNDSILNIKDYIQDLLYELYDVMDTNITHNEEDKLKDIISRLSNISNEIDDFWFREDREHKLREEKYELENKLNKLKETFPDIYNVLFNI